MVSVPLLAFFGERLRSSAPPEREYPRQAGLDMPTPPNIKVLDITAQYIVRVL
jgi:hypothetical protein